MWSLLIIFGLILGIGVGWLIWGWKPWDEPKQSADSQTEPPKQDFRHGKPRTTGRA